MNGIEIAGLAAVARTVEHVNSARPDAPVVPDRHRPSLQRPALTIVPARAAAARGLRRLADAVAPPAPHCAPHPAAH